MKYILTLLLSTMLCANAEVKLASIFTDHAVLQQGSAVPIWGTAHAGANVKVSFAGQHLETTARKNGKWQLSLDPLTATFTPSKLTVKSGKSEITRSDVLVGEVWICSGQSNMATTLERTPDIKKLVTDAKNIRAFEVPRTVALTEQESLKGSWEINVPNSAVGASFAYFLHQHANTPIGIIHASWGSTSIEAWMPRDMTATVPHFNTLMQEFDADKKTIQEIKTILKGKKPWSKKQDIFLRRQSNIVYNAMMAPIAPYACRGLVWYQGERNTQSMHGMIKEPWFSRNSGMLKYGDTFTQWIKRYRKEWNNEQMHFLTVMLPGYYKPLPTGPQKGHNHPDSHSFAWMRESQLKSLQLENTNVVNTIDLGDLTNIHPPDKLPIGKRLALLAARDTLGKKIPAHGPMMSKVQVEQDKLIVHFQHAAGLKTKDNKPPKGFWISDDSQHWIQAEAEIKDNTVILTSKSLSKPLHVRYAFTGKPDVNLINSADLPAYPFRSDTFPPKDKK